MRVTIKDVAERAGVSITTVSRVFNGYTDISEKTKARITRIAQEMNYTPNAAARTLSSKKQKTIALILNDLELNRKTTMSMEVLSGVYQFTEDEDIEFVFFATTSLKQKEKNFQQFCNEKNITGAVIQGLRVDDQYYKEIFHSQIPVVLIDIDINLENIGSASIDNIQAAREAVEYLIQLGHTNIAMLNGRREATVSMEREAGYLQALKKNNLPFVQDYVQYANFSEEIAGAITQDIIQRHSEVTAIFCASDLMAIGAMKTIQSVGLSVPEDISIIGFDDIVLTQYLSPTLSSVTQDMKLIGYEAAKLLNKLMVGEKTSHRIFVPHELKIRGSVGPIKASYNR